MGRLRLLSPSVFKIAGDSVVKIGSKGEPKEDIADSSNPTKNVNDQKLDEFNTDYKQKE